LLAEDFVSEKPSKSAVANLVATELSIGYNDSDILQGPLNIGLTTGQCLVISGPSGIGKTTFLHTLAGYLSPVSGELLLNNQQPGQAAIRYLPQKPWIINGSLADNLAVLAPKASAAEMRQALILLGMDDLISSKNNGLNYHVNEHGEGVSGGQLQRLALARVLLSPASLVLLDEPTANLDAQSRQYVLTAIAALKPRCILVIASHDANVLALADQQLCFEYQEAK